MIKQGQWTVFPARLVRHMRTLRISPIGVAPQRDHRPRTIVDYSFCDVNEDTAPWAPSKAMQFGRALHRILCMILEAHPRFGTVYISKVDIADGFYRVWLLPSDIPTLGVALPTTSGEEPIIGFPLALPMGWVNSPPYFTAATETIVDLANAALATIAKFPSHRLEAISETDPDSVVDYQDQPSPSRAPPVATTVPEDRIHEYILRPLASHDVYVDDFLSLVQGGKRCRLQVKRSLLHALDSVFRGLDASDSPHRQEPAYVKKFLKGDGMWATVKLVLGWLIDTVRKTIQLPPHRVERLQVILQDLPRTLKRVATSKWQQVLGELCSMSLDIPGTRGLFSTLQHALRFPETRRIRLMASVHDFLDDFRHLAQTLSLRPNRISEVMPQQPGVIGACDAAGSGMGGVHFVPTLEGIIPLLWRAKFDASVLDRLVTFRNRKGDITNSDLELAASVVHAEVLTQQVDIREHTIHNFYDNTSTTYWHDKGSTTSAAPVAYLLHLHSLHQRFHSHVPMHDYIPGDANRLADECSRLWRLTDSELLARFNSLYPQTRSWQLCRPTSQMLSATASALCSVRSTPASYLHAPAQRITIGNVGKLFATNIPWIHSFSDSKIPSPLSKSSLRVTDPARFLAAVKPYDLAQWKTPYVRWARGSPVWGPKTLAKWSQEKWTSASSASCALGVARTTPQPE
jgi:hypothetical protein